MNSSNIQIGRGRSADIIIEDISVSRLHATIKMTEDGYMLEDNGSKFGTLLLLPPGLHKINSDTGLFIQSSRTTLLFTVKTDKSLIKSASPYSSKTVETSPITYSGV